MELNNLSPYLSGIMLILIGLYGMVRSYQEWRLHDEPAKRLALVLMVSFALFGIVGGVSIIMLIAIDPEFWVIEATAITSGYLLLVYATLSMLTRLRTIQKKPRTGGAEEKLERQRVKKVKLPLPSAGVVKSRKDAVLLLRAIANYAGRPILVIGREHPDEWVERAGIEPDEYIWLTRV